MNPQVKRCSAPATYEAHKDLVNEDLATVLPSILEKMEWGTNELILDHGCGTGSTCLKYYVPYAEKSNSTVFALDNCEEMIKFGSQNFAHPRVKYMCGTLTDDESPVKDLKFNKIFSIYSLHFIDDFRRELKALFDSLNPGGELFLVTKLHAHFYDLYNRLVKHDKYGVYSKLHLTIPRWMSESGENAEIVTSAFVDSGFEIKESVDRENSHVFENPGLIADFLFSLNGFAKTLSPEEHDELREIYHAYFIDNKTKGNKSNDDSADSEYTFHWYALYILLKKPE